MRTSESSGRHLDRVVLLGLLMLFLFVPPSMAWWATARHPWYLPYLIWLGVIGLGAWLQWWRERHDERHDL